MMLGVLQTLSKAYNNPFFYYCPHLNDKKTDALREWVSNLLAHDHKGEAVIQSQRWKKFNAFFSMYHSPPWFPLLGGGYLAEDWIWMWGSRTYAYRARGHGSREAWSGFPGCCPRFPLRLPCSVDQLWDWSSDQEWSEYNNTLHPPLSFSLKEYSMWSMEGEGLTQGPFPSLDWKLLAMGSVLGDFVARIVPSTDPS